MSRNVELLKKHTGWQEADCEKFIHMICEYLDSCGYFMQDLDAAFLNTLPGDKVELYSKAGVAKWILDFALHFNMCCGNNYIVKLNTD